jgi:methylenetetrahydrofolate dehydrogenase (NADP+)/methenyltetrahydrofolate cyclohydrolase
VLADRPVLVSTTVMRGDPLAASLKGVVRADLATLRAHDVTPGLGTVLMSDDEGDVAFMDRKHDACATLGLPTRRVDLSPDAPAEDLYAAVEALAADERVTALFVQVPLPDHVDLGAVRARIPPAADPDCFAPENLGRLAAADPRVVPATPAAVLRLLDAYDVETAGADAVVVGRNTAICRPLASLLLDRDATVTVCHSHTEDLAAQTRAADLLVTAAGTPGLVDGSMIRQGAAVVDISVNRVATDAGGNELVGDVDAESVTPKAGAITPVPGGVGPLTLACLLRNVVDVTARATGVDAAVDASPTR